MTFKVFQINHTSKYLDDVIALGDSNKKTLGLFPKDAFKESASKKRIIIAIDEANNELVGYLLYSISRRKMLVSIVHLCVSSDWRGKGISRLLFAKLNELTKDGYSGIRVRCRIDYEANKVWPKLGFVAVGEMDGRGKNTRLIVWRFDYDQPSLFSYAFQTADTQSVKVVIDANVFFQLQYPEEPSHEESLPLLEPWLDIDLYITPEMKNEIARNKDKAKRNEARRFADTFHVVTSKSSQRKFKNIQNELLPLFPSSLSESDESDLRQLTYAISSEVPFFVTRDGPMLDRSDEIFEKFDIQVVRPADLILMQDELLRGEEYSPSRLAGSQIRIEKVHSQQSENLVNSFLSNQSEKKAHFNKRIQLALSNASRIDTFIVVDSQEKEYGLISYSRQTNSELEIPIFRVGQDAICQVVAKHLVNDVILTASAEGRNTIRISDGHLHKYIVSALQEAGFFYLQKYWIKITLQEIVSISDLLQKLSNDSWPSYTTETLKSFSTFLQNSPTTENLLEIEKALWPIKFENLNIPVFIVPIKPEWAMHLFDADIAGQDLFGGDPSLILNVENVYYRSSKPKVISSPGRVLWYVSLGKKRYQGVMQIKACSYIDEVLIGKPKTLFSRYKKLGIYKWKDVYNEVADGDLTKEIMVFKFSKTEIFKYPIHLSQLQAMWEADGKKFNNAISPLSIGRDHFFRLYNLGMKGQ